MEKDSLIEKSLKLVNIQKFDDALKILEQIKIDDYKTYFLKGTIYLAQNKHDLAEKNLTLASKQNNKNYLIFHNLGLIYQTKGDNNSAKENFLKRYESIDFNKYYIEDPFKESCHALYHWSPVADELKILDKKIVLNSMILKWNLITEEFKNLTKKLNFN